MNTPLESPIPEAKPEQGDMFSDTGEFLGTVDNPEHLTPIPVEITILIDGYDYSYKLNGRIKREEETFNDL